MSHGMQPCGYKMHAHARAGAHAALHKDSAHYFKCMRHSVSNTP